MSLKTQKPSPASANAWWVPPEVAPLQIPVLRKTCLWASRNKNKQLDMFFPFSGNSQHEIIQHFAALGSFGSRLSVCRAAATVAPRLASVRRTYPSIGASLKPTRLGFDPKQAPQTNILTWNAHLEPPVWRGFLENLLLAPSSLEDQIMALVFLRIRLGLFQRHSNVKIKDTNGNIWQTTAPHEQVETSLNTPRQGPHRPGKAPWPTLKPGIGLDGPLTNASPHGTSDGRPCQGSAGNPRSGRLMVQSSLGRVRPGNNSRGRRVYLECSLPYCSPVFRGAIQ